MSARRLVNQAIGIALGAPEVPRHVRALYWLRQGISLTEIPGASALGCEG